MLGSVVALPLALGLLVGFVRRTALSQHPVAAVLLAFAAAVAIHVSLDGLPALPPTRALHRFPLVLGALGLGLALCALRPVRLPPPALGVLFAAATGVALWWMAPTIFANNLAKAATVGLAVLLASIAVARGAAAMRAGSPLPSSGLPQAALAASLAASLLSLAAGYIGMALFNGALAAFSGGLALVSYLAFLRGDDTAFAPPPAVALGDAGIAFLGLAAVVILSPQPSFVAASAIALTLAAPPFAARLRTLTDRAPRAARPVLQGLAIALAALAAILVVLPGLSG